MSLPPFISTMAPPPLTAPTIAGPSRSAAQFEIKQLDCCKVCLGGLGHRYSLEYTEDNLLACPRCGLVDEAATQARNAVSVSDTMGAQLDQHDYMRTFDRDWGEFETRMEKKFKDQIDDLFHTYLIDPKTSLFGYSVPSLVKGAKMWYLRIRQVEKGALHRTELAHNASARRITYQIGAAIKFATQENGLRVVNNRLGKSHTPVFGFTKADERVKVLSASEIFERAHSLGPGQIGYMDSLTYFTKTYRRYSMLLDNAVSSLDVCLILLMQCVRRLRQLAEMPHKERLKHLLTEPKQSKKNRSWVDEDWTWFKRLNWDELLLVGYNLYQAQQCVSLWGSRCSAQVAVALTIWACMAIVGDPMPQYINITNELAASFKQTHWVSTERAVEMKNFLISWSTSIPAAGLPFPKMKLPIRGGLGDGLSGYGSDRRRRIPEAEMAATAGRTIADNWRKILQARLRTRYDVLPLDEEHDMARRLFASHGPKQDDKRCVNRLTLIGNGVGSALLPLHIPVQIVSDSPRQPNRFWSASASPPAYVESATMDTPPPEKTIEDMLATRDDSSDDGYATSSDVEARTSRVAGLGLTNLGEKDEPFAFSIGLDGFNVDKPASKAIIHELSRDSSSTISPSPILTPRHRSRSPSISAIGLHSTSENERNNTELHPHAQYIKPLKRAAERRSASRSATPVASPMSTHASLPMSPSPSVDIPLRPMPDRVDIDGDHVGQLIREREQYQTYRQGNERVHGRLVSEEVEIAMKKWVEGEKRKGTIPHVISQDYLVSLGIHGDPHQMDLRPWIESMRETMPPIEALLRAGIRPTELPPHCIIHSLVHLDQQLTCYHTDDGFAPIGEDIDNAQADKELEILFRTGDEKLEDVLLPEAERKIRKEQIDDAGIWDDDDTPRRPSKSKKTEDELGQIVNAFEGEDDDGEGIQEAMLRSYCAARDGGSRGDGWSDADPSPGPEAAKVAKKSRPGRKDGGVNRRTSTKRKKAVEEEEVGSDGTVKARSKKARRQKGADSPAPANLVVGTEETIEIAAADA